MKILVRRKFKAPVTVLEIEEEARRRIFFARTENCPWKNITLHNTLHIFL
jgi:hypothetical protein